MSTKIKRLKQNGEEFVPITLAEAVVVNTNGIPGTVQEITTLDKVLRRTIGAINNNTENINSAVETINNLIISKQDKLTAGYGIEIDSNNKISVTLSYTLYQIVTQLPEPSAQVMNTIYLVPSAGEEGNMYTGNFTDIPCPETITAENLADALRQQDPVFKFRPVTGEKCIVNCPLKQKQ